MKSTFDRDGPPHNFAPNLKQLLVCGFLESFIATIESTSGINVDHLELN